MSFLQTYTNWISRMFQWGSTRLYQGVNFGVCLWPFILPTTAVVLEVHHFLCSPYLRVGDKKAAAIDRHGSILGLSADSEAITGETPTTDVRLDQGENRIPLCRFRWSPLCGFCETTSEAPGFKDSVRGSKAFVTYPSLRLYRWTLTEVCFPFCSIQIRFYLYSIYFLVFLT